MLSLSKFDAVVVGSCTIDLFCYADRYPKAGESVPGSKYVQCLGGKGANQAVQCALLGGKVCMISKIGQDSFGDQVKEQLNRFSVDHDFVTGTSREPTGLVFITVINETGEGHQIFVRGSNNLLDEKDLLLAEHRIKNSKYMLCQLGVQRHITLEAMKLARKNQVKVIFNAAPVVKDFKVEYLEYTNVLCVNETEARSVMSHSLAAYSVRNESKDKMDRPTVKEIMDHLFCRYANLELIIVTMGSSGCCFATRSNIVANSSSLSFVPAVDDIPVVDTTGAGDSFLGALTYYLANYEHLALKDVVSRCCEIAAYCVQKRGSTMSYPCRKDLPDSLFIP